MAEKMRWADMTDDWDPEPVSVTKHGVKVKKRVPPEPQPASYVPPHLRKQDKNQTPSKTKDGNL
jgi:hypothetical protein